MESLAKNVAKKQHQHRKRKWQPENENNLQFGFISTQESDFLRSLCLLCGKKLSNQAMVFSKLKRHHEGKHELVAHKHEKFFCIQKHKTQSNRILISSVSNKVLEASYVMAKIIAKTSNLIQSPKASGNRKDNDK